MHREGRATAVRGLASRLHGAGREWVLVALAATLLFATRAPFVPPSLEDIDSLNFDLGVHDYDPAAHRPHPPGYPVYIVLAKLAHTIFASHAAALASLSIVFGSLVVVPLYLLFRDLTSRSAAAIACVLTLLNPHVWFNSVRPMSDIVGLFAATTVQWLLVGWMARGGRAWYAGAALAGVAAGIRIQIVWLTVPVMLYGCFRHRSRSVATLTAFGAGVAMWAVPLLYVLGGPQAAFASVAPVVADTLSVESIVSQWTPRKAAVAATDFLIAPWHSPAFAAVVLLLAAAGGIALARRHRHGLATALLLFVPYSVYHVLVQDTGTLRYGIPVIPFVALLASVPLARASAAHALLASAAFGIAAGAITLPALQAYHTTPSPAVQAVTKVREHISSSERVVASAHYVFDRYLPSLPHELERLPPVEDQEWQTLRDFWTGGRREPVLFMRDPGRTTLLLFGRDSRETLGRWSWPRTVQPFLRGARPGMVELVRLTPPRWVTQQGFLAMSEGRHDGGYMREHRLSVRPGPWGRVFIASGSLHDSSEAADLFLRQGEEVTAKWTVRNDFSVRALLPPLVSDGYAPVLLESSAPARISDVWVERDTRPVIRPAQGFEFPEHDETARRFRWTAPESRASVYLPTGTARLTIAGRIPIKYYDTPVDVSLFWQGKPLASFAVNGEQFRFEQDLERSPHTPWGELTITSSHSFVPHEHVRNGDRRRLALRIYELELEQ